MEMKQAAIIETGVDDHKSSPLLLEMCIEVAIPVVWFKSIQDQHRSDYCG